MNSRQRGGSSAVLQRILDSVSSTRIVVRISLPVQKSQPDHRNGPCQHEAEETETDEPGEADPSSGSGVLILLVLVLLLALVHKFLQTMVGAENQDNHLEICTRLSRSMGHHHGQRLKTDGRMPLDGLRGSRWGV
ncbi:hypothetical protein QBC38DRAFT_451607 [Podospora fimiseda]|uniref:Uncharacterized protein n=1 Tax=Podospora fimiseda TaxID=252190 RepID=A0AAN7H3L8_9PEZI|nr:hypothetical protein QBC38DRAFT_451607 [Podospora fimiseda]